MWEVLSLVLAQAVQLGRVEVGGDLQELVRQHQAADRRVETVKTTTLLSTRAGYVTYNTRP